MPHCWIAYNLVTLSLFACARFAAAQTGAPQTERPYRFQVAVNEVILTFHAADAQGKPVNNLKLDELRLFDNGNPPGKVLEFQVMPDEPIRAGILLDTSKSMENALPTNRAIATEYAQKLLRQQTDQAFVMDFGFASHVIQPWTGNPAALTSAIHRATAGRENPLGGTALFDSLYQVCFSEFGKLNHAASGNFILLFTDGEDNTSHTALKDVVDICQRSDTAIYAFRPQETPGTDSSGPRNLMQLASETGGRLFHSDDSPAAIDQDLNTIEADLRSQYRLVYRPVGLNHDGTFHRIALLAPDRVSSLSVRTGYYAPAH